MDLREIKIGELPLVGPSYAKRLKKLEIETVWDLFHHVPFRFLDFSKNININELQIGETATVKGTVTTFTNQYTKKGKPMQIVTIEDESGPPGGEVKKVNAIWFNQIYLSSTFRKGTKVAIAGQLSFLGRQKAIIAPEYEILNDDGNQIHTGGLIPVYNTTAGISSKWLRRKINDAWKRYLPAQTGKNYFEEFLPEEILKKYDLVNFNEAVRGIHFPKSMEEFEKAKRRLAFNELLELHGKNIKRKKKWNENKIDKLSLSLRDKEKIYKFINSLDFELTLSQSKVVKEILKDLEKNIPMNRLLEGDVGSGKTVVAAIVAYAVFLSNKKTVIMAPTQILANQHFNTLKKLFEKEKLKVGLWTGSEKQIGEFDILIGTHALLNKRVDKKKIGLIVIDEQHKFGVEQRNKIVGKEQIAHVLTMTATPIPRTVALTFFGDLDLSILTEFPKGRQKIVTWVIPEFKRKGMYQWMKLQITNYKCQIFVVCPLIDESETETMKDIKNVNTEYLKLKKEFTDLEVGLMHGKLKSKEKDEVIEKFKNGETHILVTTPVVEVGIDISNATVMIIEAADRFGLASLHQLRGRVGRGEKQSYCLLMTESDTEKVQMRLRAMTKSNSGFELSEIDLAMRGPGEIYGSKQSGIPELKIADWNDLEMIKDTREVAQELAGRL